MPMPQAQNSPFGNGPKDISSPVPEDQAGAQAVASAPQAPEMGAAPAAGTPPEAAPDNSGGNPFLKHEPLSPQAKSDDQPNPFLSRSEEGVPGYTVLSPRLRKDPHGKLEVLRPGGKWEQASNEEMGHLANFQSLLNTWAVHGKDDVPRFVGAILGGIGGEMLAPAATPYSGIAGAGIGQAAAGAIANKFQDKPVTFGGTAKDFLVGATAQAIPVGAGRFLEQQAAQYGAEAAISPLVERGGQILTQRIAAEQAGAKELGLPIGATKTQQEIAVMKNNPERLKLYQMQTAEAQMLKDKFDTTISNLKGPYEAELGGEAPNFGKTIGTVFSNHEAAISSLKKEAFEKSGNQVYDMDPVLSKMREELEKNLKHNIFKDNGRIDAKLLDGVKNLYGGIPENSRALVGDYLKLQNSALVGKGLTNLRTVENASLADSALNAVASQSEEAIATADMPKLKPGLRLDEMDVFRKNFGDQANFQGAMRNDVNRSYGEIYNTMRRHMDDKITDVLKDSNPAGAAKLMANKDFYSRFKEDAEQLQQMVEHNPTNAARALINGRNPEQLNSLKSILDEKQMKFLSGGFLESLTDPLLDTATGKMRVAPVESAWKKVDPKVKELLYGKEGVKDVDTMISYAKAIDTKNIITYVPQTDTLTAKAVEHLKHMEPTGIAGFISSLFKKNDKARDFFLGEASDVLMPTGKDIQSLQNKQKYSSKASQVLLSKPVKAGAAAYGAEIATPHKESLVPYVLP